MSGFTREIVTLQVGHYASFVGTHWWNIQVNAVNCLIVASLWTQAGIHTKPIDCRYWRQWHYTLPNYTQKSRLVLPQSTGAFDLSKPSQNRFQIWRFCASNLVIWNQFRKTTVALYFGCHVSTFYFYLIKLLIPLKRRFLCRLGLRVGSCIV